MVAMKPLGNFLPVAFLLSTIMGSHAESLSDIEGTWLDPKTGGVWTIQPGGKVQQSELGSGSYEKTIENGASYKFAFKSGIECWVTFNITKSNLAMTVGLRKGASSCPRGYMERAEDSSNIVKNAEGSSKAFVFSQNREQPKTNTNELINIVTISIKTLSTNGKIDGSVTFVWKKSNGSYELTGPFENATNIESAVKQSVDNLISLVPGFSYDTGRLAK